MDMLTRYGGKLAAFIEMVTKCPDCGKVSLHNMMWAKESEKKREPYFPVMTTYAGTEADKLAKRVAELERIVTELGGRIDSVNRLLRSSGL